MADIQVHGDDLNLKGAAWDHIFTEHGLEAVGPLYGWVKKSHWFGSEDQIRHAIGDAFQAFKSSAGHGNITLHRDASGRTVRDVALNRDVGTGADGKSTKRVRLVLEVKHSGDCFLVTAFPF